MDGQTDAIFIYDYLFLLRKMPNVGIFLMCLLFFSTTRTVILCTTTPSDVSRPTVGSNAGHATYVGKTKRKQKEIVEMCNFVAKVRKKPGFQHGEYGNHGNAGCDRH
jgi:hypothetical protein